MNIDYMNIDYILWILYSMNVIFYEYVMLWMFYIMNIIYYEHYILNIIYSIVEKNLNIM